MSKTGPKPHMTFKSYNYVKIESVYSLPSRNNLIKNEREKKLGVRSNNGSSHANFNGHTVKHHYYSQMSDSFQPGEGYQDQVQTHLKIRNRTNQAPDPMCRESYIGELLNLGFMFQNPPGFLNIIPKSIYIKAKRSFISSTNKITWIHCFVLKSSYVLFLLRQCLV